MAIVLAYFDGAAEPNPGLASWGFIVRELNGFEPVYSCGVLNSHRSNNYAEYTAVGKLLAWLTENRALNEDDYLVINGDSKLVVEQLNGKWRCNSETLQPLLQRCREMLNKLPCRYAVQWIPREKNSAADVLSQAAWVGHTGMPFPVRHKTAAQS